MKIHPTAIIEPGANLAGDIEIGPWCHIGSQVTLGPGCVLQTRCVFEGRVEAGENNFFGHGCVIGAAPQDFSFDPSADSCVRIGSNNTFREYVTIHRGTKPGTETVVGSGCFLMVGTHLAHNVKFADRVIVANNALFAGYVEVGDSSVIGGGSVFHQFIRIGRLAMVSGGSRFNKDIPPFCVADKNNVVRGINVIGLRRAGFSSASRTEIRRAFKTLYRTGLNITEALAAASKETWLPEAEPFFEFIRSSKRGVCALTSTHEREEDEK